ncbi:MAG: hypothetical protein KJO55_07030 [Gammaproteobacteria bacterium]|nr:hypothetical protein [Gammaproteobacteria bacterium]NND60549.1 hypothetical protein [Gammaproteobacteria bacterium]
MTFGRIVIAIMVVLLLMGLLGIEEPRLDDDRSNFSQFALILQIRAALQMLVAVFIGALIARGRFIVPAALLSLILWAFTTVVLYQIAAPAGGANLVATAIANLPGLLLHLAASIGGAALGGWFYRREFTGVDPQ